MKLVRASYKIEHITPNALQLIERAGRTCYKSEDKITDTSAEGFVTKLVNRGHHSVLEHATMTVRFICDRGVSHELVRHRLASFSQESTRYCNYGSKFGGVTFIIPPWLPLESRFYSGDKKFIPGDEGLLDSDACIWLNAMLEAERAYTTLLDLEWTPQDARAVLPNSLKTEIVVTANFREWRHIFKERTSPQAHPQMRELMSPLKSEMSKRFLCVFNGI